MKRYTREFVKDNIKRAKEWYTGNTQELQVAIAKCERYLAICDRGLITDWECMRETRRILWGE